VEHYLITQKNNQSIIVGGVRVLSEFSSEQVSVAVVGATVQVTGQRLKIARFNENEIEVTGKIENVETVQTRSRRG